MLVVVVVQLLLNLGQETLNDTIRLLGDFLNDNDLPIPDWL